MAAAASATGAPSTTAPTGAATGKQSAARLPFRVGTQNVSSLDGYQVTTSALGSNPQILANYNPSANSYLRGVYILVTATASSNSATVAFEGDAPFIALQTISFNDAAQRPIVGPFSGYDLYLVNKYGGYQFLDDPRMSQIYYATTGSGSSGGSFQFMLYVPLEVTQRDTLGSLLNKNESAQFQLQMTVNTAGAVYSTAPTTAPALTITCIEDGWWAPKAADIDGNPQSANPPLLGTTQYWVKQQIGSNGLNGSIQQQLSAGLGFPIRTAGFELYGTTAATRAAAEGSGVLSNWQLIYKGTTLWNVPTLFWKDRMSRLYGYSANYPGIATTGGAGALDVPGALDSGVYVLPFSWDAELQPGNELRWGYLDTQQGDLFQLFTTLTLSGGLNIFQLVNYVASPTTASALRVGG